MIPLVFVCVLYLQSSQVRIPVQPVRVLTVELGSTVTLQCVTDKDNIFWYKQVAGLPPRVICSLQSASEPKFFREFKNGRFKINGFDGKINLTISDIVKSDEAVYYCASNAFYTEFGNGTHLIIKGISDHLNNFKCQNASSENRLEVINGPRFHTAVLGLLCALGVCGVLIVSLIFCTVRSSRQHRRKIREHASIQITDDEENLTYAALRFSRKKQRHVRKSMQNQQEIILSP